MSISAATVKHWTTIIAFKFRNTLATSRETSFASLSYTEELKAEFQTGKLTNRKMPFSEKQEIRSRIVKVKAGLEAYFCLTLIFSLYRFIAHDFGIR